MKKTDEQNLSLARKRLQLLHSHLRSDVAETFASRINTFRIAASLTEVFNEDNLVVEAIAVPGVAKIFLTYEKEATEEKYAYSGVRVLSPMSDEEAIANAKRLSLTSSSWKNWLINHAVKDGALDTLSEESRKGIPESVWSKREVYGGRVIIIPEKGSYREEPIEQILKNPDHPYFEAVSTPVYAAIGKRLNALGGKLKVTPDFGPNAGTADKMHDHTEHALGITPGRNGSGGKSEYSITSILTVLKKLGIEKAPKDAPITLIGSAGALGSGVVVYLQAQGFTNVTLCDLQYEKFPPEALPRGWKVTPAVNGKFTDDCLEQSGEGHWLITTAYGDEMLRSNWHKLERGTLWVGAQNKDLPEKEDGIIFARTLRDKGIVHIPGQILTIGGTAASWVEWRARQEGRPFSRLGAHEVVERLTDKLVTNMLEQSRRDGISPYEAMLDYARKSRWQEPSHAARVSNEDKTTIRSRL